MTQTVEHAAALFGTITLPADKSVAHRTAMLASLAEGTSRIANYPDSADPQSTLACMRSLGTNITEEDGILVVEGHGLHGLQAPDGPLDCGNSGTTMRLLSGILAGQPFNSTLTGDASLSRRPMGRVQAPLAEMGAQLDLTDGHAPVRIQGGRPLSGIEYRLPVPSAQVKSCVLLAGLFAEGETTVIETARSRDHTERMLGLDVVEMEGTRYLTVEGGRPSRPGRGPCRATFRQRRFSRGRLYRAGGDHAPPRRRTQPVAERTAGGPPRDGGGRPD